MLKKDKIIQEKYNGVHPVCTCGCGQQTRYEASIKDYCKWISGHQSKVKGHWGDLKSEKRVKAISDARKQRFASGEFDYIKDAIKEARKDPELGRKISQGAKGIPKPKPAGFGVGRVQSAKTREKMSKSAIKNILKTGRVKRSRLEYMFEELLSSLSINYTHSYYIESINKIYDFYLPGHNILIEVDGDFWHCHPDKFPIPECKTQKINVANDVFKNQWATDNGYILLRFWEHDIKNNIKHIKQTLQEHLAK